ncbi:MAG: flagellar protein FlaG [Pseudomonadota bacterium]
MDIAATGNNTINLQRPADNAHTIAAPATIPVPAVAVQTVDAVTTAAPAISADDVKQAVQDINKSMQSLSQGLEFTLDADSERPVVRVVDLETRELIRQIPSAEALEIARSLDQVLGKLIRQQA